MGTMHTTTSDLLPKAPGLKDRDPLREAVDEASKHDLPLIAYCVVQQNGHCLAEHPEWEMRDAAAIASVGSATTPVTWK
jgi:hypothetical protein